MSELTETYKALVKPPAREARTRKLFTQDLHSQPDNPLSAYFTNKIIIVTGASSGIGRAMANFFANHGAKVVLAARNKEKLAATAREITQAGGQCLVVPTDVGRERDCYYLIDKTLEAYGRIDILVNNAGISMRAPFAEVKLDVIRKVMDTNFWGAVYCTKYALPYLLESKGSLVAISSISGIVPLPGRTGYTASKHALDGFMNNIRIEYLKNDLHVLNVHAGFTQSNIRKRALNKNGQPQRESPRNEARMMTAAAVASRVGKAIIGKKRDITLTREGRLITWLYKLMPNLADKLIYREIAREGKPVG